MRFLVLSIATFLGSGYSPWAPGTAGTLAFLPFYWFYFGRLSPVMYVVSLVIISLAGVWSSNYASAIFGKKDPSKVVIDEVAGYMVTMLFIPMTPVTMTIGFFLSRFFDIIKPPPARQFESLPGGTGIMMDDIMAGIYANICMWVVVLTGSDKFIGQVIERLISIYFA